ncbi:unnamed protein product [Closterium sp. NIES-54]
MTAQALYDAVVARHSSPTTAAIGRLLLPYLFPELSAFATVADLVTHLRTSDARYRAAIPAEFLPTNQPPMFITLYFIVTSLPDSLRSVKDHFLTLDPTSLTIDLLEQHLLAAETSTVAIGVAHGTPGSPFFEGCSPSPLSFSFASAAAADVSVFDDVGAASTSAKRRNSKGKGGRGSGGGSGGNGGGSGSGSGGSGRGGGGSGGGGGGGTGGGSGGSCGGGGGNGGSGGSGGGGTGGGRSRPRRGGPGGGRGQQQQRRSETQTHQQLREWLVQRGTGEGSETCPYAIHTGVRAGQTCGNAEGDCYWCVPPDLGITAAALGACAYGTPPVTAPAEALHTFTLDSGASRCFFRDNTSLTPLPPPVPIRLADPSGGPAVARSSTVLPCLAVPSGSLSGLHLPSFSTNLVSTTALQDAMVSTTTPGGQRVSICTCTRTGRHLATFTLRPRSSLYTLATEPPQVAASPQVSALGQVAASCSCRLLSHQTILWHHRLGHPSLPRLRGMHSRLLVSDLPRSLPPLPPSLAPPSLRRGAAPHHSSLFLVSPDDCSSANSPHRLDDYTRYTTAFPLRSKGEVSDVLIPWIRRDRLQLCERFGQDLPVLCLHSDRGGEFSSDLLQDLCRGEGITQLFTLPDSTQQNGIAERRIGLVMEVARTSMIHAAAPHFLWPFAVRYAAHQLNLWPHVSLPETSPTLRWTGKVGDASVFRDVTFDESVPFYRLFPYRSAPPPPPPLFLAPGPPPVDPFLPQGPAPSGVSQVDPLPGTAPVQVAIVSGVAPGAASGGAAPGVAASGGAASEGAESGGAGSEGAGYGGAEPAGVEPGGAESEGAESGGAEPWGAASSRDPTEPGAAGAVGAGAGVAGVGGPGAGGAGATGAGVGGTGAESAGAAGAGAGAGGVGDTVWLRPYFVPLVQQVLGVPSTGLPPPFLYPPPDQSQPPLQPASPLLAPSPYIEQSGGLTERREPASRPVSPVRTARRAPRSRPPPVPSTHTMALRPSSVPLRVPQPAPPESSLPEVPDPESDRAHAASPTVARLLASALTDPFFESATASSLVAELLDFAAACRLDYATALVAESVSASHSSIGDECALGTDVLEDRQEDFECLAADVPRFTSMLLAPEGDPDAPDIPTPRSYTGAITGPYSSQWQAAMDAEMASWKSTGTFVDEVPPPGANIVDGMWIFRGKRPPGSPPAFMARYVARGFSQRQGVDYFQTFSPTPKMTTLWVLLHVAAQRDYELHSPDFSTAFLQSSLHEEIWLRQPLGFTGTFPAGTQWSLRQPFYGLRQAPREWHDTLRTTLAALGFAPSTADTSLFLRTDTSLPPFYVLVYVDDLVFATADTDALTLVLQRFGFQYSSPQLTPLSTSHSLSAPPSDESVEPSGPYPELVGCLMYLMTCTRPDLAYLLSLLARYVAPGRHRKVHWDAAKRVLRYLCSTSGMGLVLGGRGPVVLTGHADTSWVDDSATQRSSQGYTFSLGSGSVSCRSTDSSSVLSSSCEAEIYVGAMATQELRWLTYLLTDLGEQPRSPPVLYIDNKAMIALCQEYRLEHRTKHIALRYFLARELQQRGQLRLAYVATRANTADVFTKALSPGGHCCVVQSYTFTCVCLPSCVRALHAWSEKRNEPPPSKIEALDGSNYEEWSGRMRSAFKCYKLLKLAMGEEKMPEEGDARDRWIEKIAVLYNLILQSVNNDMFQHIKDLVELDDSGPKAWKLLRDVIQPNTLPMVIMLEKELAALSMRLGDDVKPVLDKIKDTYARMAAAGSNVSQMQQCTKIISVLDNSWDNLIPTLNTQQD